MKEVVVCIPTYNAESTIAQTIESLMIQDYPIKKIKIFDNQSTDRTAQIITQFISKNSTIELSINETNVGAEGNFTKCIQAAEGDYCAIAHADDLYNPNYISTSIKALEAHPDCVASFCGAYEVDASGVTTGERFYPSELKDKEISILSLNDLLGLTFKYANFITCPSVMVRSNVYKNNIKFWNGERFKSSADLDVWLRLTQFGNILGIKDKIMRYRVAEASYSFRIAKKRITRHDIFLVLDHYKSLYQSSLSDNDEENYYFLNLKDQALRSLNILRTNNKSVTFPSDIDFHLTIVLKKMFASKWHFKMGLSIVGIYAITKIAKLGWKK